MCIACAARCCVFCCSSVFYLTLCSLSCASCLFCDLFCLFCCVLFCLLSVYRFACSVLLCRPCFHVPAHFATTHRKLGPDNGAMLGAPVCVSLTRSTREVGYISWEDRGQIDYNPTPNRPSLDPTQPDVDLRPRPTRIQIDAQAPVARRTSIPDRNQLDPGSALPIQVKGCVSPGSGVAGRKTETLWR